MNRTHLSIFNQWLDAVVGGRSAPPPTALDPTLQEASSAARQLHDLAQAADTASPHRSLPPTWEEFMHAHQLDASPPVASTSPPPTRSSRVKGSGYPAAFNALTSRPARLASNILLATIVLAVLLAGAWRAADSFRSGPPEEPSTIPFGAFIQDNATPAAPLDLPTATDCTIEPLTVDDVLWYITDPYASQKKSPDAEPLANFPFQDPATPPATNEPLGPASQEDLDEMVATQRMWMACVLADSPFQVWATVSPDVVGRMLAVTFPPLTSEEDARVMLEALAAGTWEAAMAPNYFPGFLGSSCFDIAVISSDPTRSYGLDLVAAVPEGTASRSAYYVVDTLWSDGPMTNTGYATPASAERMDIGLQGEANLFVLRWNDARQAWMIESWPGCG